LGVEGESAELGAVGAEDADLAAGDEEDDAPAFEGGSDADVVEAAAVAQGEVSLLGDAVVADAVAEGVDLDGAVVGEERLGIAPGGGGPMHRADHVG
jgi:hypothetical protein